MVPCGRATGLRSEDVARIETARTGWPGVSDHTDYSSTPLWRKLGIKEGARVLCTRAPEGFVDELQRLSPLPDGVEFLRRPVRDVDIAIAFVTSRSDLAARFAALSRSIAPSGRLRNAWPKKAAGIAADLD